MKAHYGCSGFYYKDWKGLFYPEDLPKKEWLNYYCEHFSSVEINSSFYRLPLESTLEKWREKVPGNFSFAMKGSRYITHLKKLSDVGESVLNFYRLMDTLRDKLGCVLWQLPGNFHLNTEKLESFCKLLAKDHRHAIEFRHTSWFTQEVYDLLEKYNVSLCLISAPGNLPENMIQTSDMVYLRFHGKDQWYNYKYSEEELQKWADRLKKMNPKNLFVYFNNDYHANAVSDCKTLIGLMED